MYIFTLGKIWKGDFTENLLLKVFLVPRTTAHGQSPCLMEFFAQKSLNSVFGFSSQFSHLASVPPTIRLFALVPQLSSCGAAVVCVVWVVGRCVVGRWVVGLGVVGLGVVGA